jgi:hypothetical protein
MSQGANQQFERKFAGTLDRLSRSRDPFGGTSVKILAGDGTVLKAGLERTRVPHIEDLSVQRNRPRGLPKRQLFPLLPSQAERRRNIAELDY